MTTTQDEEQRRRLAELATLTANLVMDVRKLTHSTRDLENRLNGMAEVIKVITERVEPNRPTGHASSVDPRIAVCSNCLAVVERGADWIAAPNGHAVRPDGSLKCSGNRA